MSVIALYICREMLLCCLHCYPHVSCYVGCIFQLYNVKISHKIGGLNLPVIGSSLPLYSVVARVRRGQQPVTFSGVVPSDTVTGQNIE